jgi:hypothetical protein
LKNDKPTAFADICALKEEIELEMFICMDELLSVRSWLLKTAMDELPALIEET